MNDRPVIILGMHRSGTSLLAGSLEAAGLYLGDVNNYARFNQKGNKEHEVLRDLNDEILARYDADWKRPPVNVLPLQWTTAETDRLKELTAPFQTSSAPWGFKDPRSIWTLEGWIEVFPKTRFVGIFRQPADVVASLAGRPGDLHLSAEDSLRLWTVTNQRLLNLHDRLRFPILEFDSADGGQLFKEKVRNLAHALELPDTPDSFFSEELVHQKHRTVPDNPDIIAILTELQIRARSISVQML